MFKGFKVKIGSHGRAYESKYFREEKEAYEYGEYRIKFLSDTLCDVNRHFEVEEMELKLCQNPDCNEITELDETWCLRCEESRKVYK